MTFRDHFIRNPVSFTVGIFTILSMLSGAAWAVENRYNQTIQVAAVEKRMLTQEMQRIDDEVFKYEFLEQQGKATPLDKAMKKRLEKRLEDLKKEKQHFNETN